jgi:hypothetical protein
MTRKTAAAVTLSVAALSFGGSYALQETRTTSESVAAAEPMRCEDWTGTFTQKECFGAGVIRFVALHNLQGAVQFCKWRDANPGEWSRLKGYTASGTLPLNIVTWLGGSIKNDIEAYFALGAPVFTLLPNTAPNACTGKLVKPPVVEGVTPGETDATVTVAPGG